MGLKLSGQGFRLKQPSQSPPVCRAVPATAFGRFHWQEVTKEGLVAAVMEKNNLGGMPIHPGLLDAG